MIREFTHFVREKGGIGLAVGLVVGAAVTKIVASLVDSFVTPVIGVLTGQAGDLIAMTYTIAGMTFKWGAFLASLIDFLAVMLVVYLVFVKSPLGKLDKKSD